MARELSPEEVRIWQQKIKVSLKWRKPKEERWKKTIGYYKGRYQESPTDDFISVNLVYPHVKIIIPAIYIKNPDVLVIPTQKRAEGQARTMQKYLRYLLKEIGLKEEMKLCILDALLCSHGWMETGYQADFETLTGEAEEKTLVQKAMEMVGLKKKEAKPTYSIEPNERIVSEMPWVRRVSPFDMVVPAFSSRADELAWVARRFTWPVRDIMENPVFVNNDDVQASTDALKILQERDREEFTELGISDPDLQYAIFYEIWDGRTDETFTILDNSEKPLKEPEPNPLDMIDSRFPFDMLRFNEITDEFYPLNDIEAWEPQIHELNSIRTQQSNHRKRYNRRYIAKADAFDEIELNKLVSGVDGAVAKTTEDNVEQVFKPVIDAQLPPEVYSTEARIKDDIVNIGGVTDYQRGSLAQGAKTATEASIVESHSSFRNDERLDVVGSFAASICRKLAQISQALLPPNQVFSILGEDGLEWVHLTSRKEIRGEFLYEVIFGSSAPMNREVEREQFKELYAMIAQDPAFNPVRSRIELLRKFGTVNPEEWLNPKLAQMLRMTMAMQALAGQGPNGNGNMRPGTSESRVPSSASERQKITKGVRRPGGKGGRPLVSRP